MTADSPTCLSPIDAAPWSRPDPVRARVAFDQPRTHTEQLQARRAKPAASDVSLQPHGIHLLPDTRAPRPRRPHPGDVIYWVACLSGVCLLILSATR